MGKTYKMLRKQGKASKHTCVSLGLTSKQALVMNLRDGDGENIGRSEYDHYITMTSSIRFHADHINMSVGVAQDTTSKSTKIFCCCLTGSGSRDPVGKWIRNCGRSRARCKRNVAKWRILLWRNVLLDMCG